MSSVTRIVGWMIFAALLEVDFRSQGHSRVLNFHSTFVESWLLSQLLLDFKSGKSDRGSTPLGARDPIPSPDGVFEVAVMRQSVAV